MAATTALSKPDIESCLAAREEMVWEHKYEEMLREQRALIAKGPSLAEYLDFFDRTQPIIDRAKLVIGSGLIVLCVD